MTPIRGAFVVGGGGLLGRAVVEQLQQQDLTVRVARNVPWSENEPALECLMSQLDGFIHEVFPSRGESDSASLPAHEAWSIIWCAGAGVTGTSEEELDREVELFSHFLLSLVETHRQLIPTLTFFYASSAGGVYAGAEVPPFTEDSTTAPLAPYGFAKLRCEEATQVLCNAGATVAIGRISNLYGPGQNISKPQGLVSHLCLAHHKGVYNKIFVSLDTLRDYIYIDDAASLVLRFIDVCTQKAPGRRTIKILASGQSLSVAEIVGTARTLLKRAPQFVHSASHQTALQARDLRLKSIVFPEIDHFPKRSFPSGFMMTNLDIGYRYRLGLTHG